MSDETDRERVYERVLNVIEYNSGIPRQPGMCYWNVFHVLKKPYGSYSHKAIVDAIRAAVDAGDVIMWEDRRGEKRLTRTLHRDLYWLIAAEYAQDDPEAELIEQASEFIDDRGASDD